MHGCRLHTDSLIFNAVYLQNGRSIWVDRTGGWLRLCRVDLTSRVVSMNAMAFQIVLRSRLNCRPFASYGSRGGQWGAVNDDMRA